MYLRALLCSLTLCALAQPAAAGDQDFQLLNKTDYQIGSVYVGPHSSSQWGWDIMGRDALSDGEAVNITFPNRTSACSHDIKIAYNDGDEAIWDSVNLCKVSKVTLYWRNGETRAVTE